MTNLNDFAHTPCNLIDPLHIDAFFEFELDPINESTLKLKTSWGCTAVDLTPVVKFSETITHLFITPEGSLQFNREDYGREGVADGGVDCITGNELSRIISNRLLKDVDQTQSIRNGMVYMWNGISNLFEPYDLQGFVNDTNTTLTNHTASINVLQSDVQAIQNTLSLVLKRLTNLETRMTNLENRVTTIEEAIYNWGADKTTPIARGNVNVYGGTSSSVDKTKGIYTHNPNTNVTGDQYFA